MTILALLMRAVRAGYSRVLDGFATLYYRLVLGRVGSRLRVGWGTWISYPRNVTVGDDVAIGRFCAFGSESSGSRLVLRNGVQVNDGVQIDYSGNVTIGDRTLISAGAAIFSHSHGTDPRSVPTLIAKEIGCDVWVGFRAIILESCQVVGTRAVIGAGTTVVKDVADGHVVVGAAARTV